MKKFIKSAAVSCTALLMAFTAMSGASAVSMSDYNYSIVDVTNIQKSIARITSLTDEQKSLYDVNFDGSIDITDATKLQKVLAGIETLGRTSFAKHIELTRTIGESSITVNMSNVVSCTTSDSSVVKIVSQSKENGKTVVKINALKEGTAEVNCANSNGDLYTYSITTSDSASAFRQEFADFFTAKGYSRAMICGMLGNIEAECGLSSEYYFADYSDVTSYGYDNVAGICMWYADNCTRFQRDCPNWQTSLEAQMEYLYQTLENNGKGDTSTEYYFHCTGCKTDMEACADTEEGAAEVAEIFCNEYERANPNYANISVRQQYAQNAWNELYS